MTDGEWADLDVLLAGWWGQPWDEQRSAAYRVALNGFEAEKVGQALMALLQEGLTFRPSAAEIVAKLVPKWTGAHFDEAWELIVEAIKRIKVSASHADFNAQHQAAIDWLAEQDPAVAAFAALRGLTGSTGTLGHEPIYSEQGGYVQHRLAKAYGDVVEVVRQRVAAGLPPVDQRMLQLRRQTGLTSVSGLAAVVENARPTPELTA